MDRFDFTAQARQLIAAGEQLYARGWVPATSGNFSLRLGEDTALVTASGKHKGRLTPADFIVTRLDGVPLGEGRPSAETDLHLQLYRRFPSVGAVLHCHSPSATVLSRRRQGSILLQGYELLKAFDGIDSHDVSLEIPVFENTQDIPALAGEVDAYLARHPHCPAYLIRGHGVYCWGMDIDGCMRQLEALDFLLQCELAG